MDNALDLKPCPFCGYPAIMDAEYGRFYAECTYCGAQGQSNPDRNRAIEFWNHRDGSAAAPPSAGRSNALSHEQAWLEIRDTMADKMLNEAQKKDFVISILSGRLANPPKFGGYNG